MRAIWIRFGCTALTAAGFCLLPLWCATIQGYVRDATGTALRDAIVQLTENGDQAAKIQTVQADSKGNYRFTSLRAGNYTLTASTASLSTSTADRVGLQENETKNLDLILRRSTTAIEFFDEPKFTVAGVTESPYVGGHGSDAVVRSAETLTHDAAALRETPSASPLQPAESEKSRGANMHHLTAAADEKAGKPLDAVREYQRAAELDATEPNLFDWGTELLVHGAPQPALEIFNKGMERFPSSSRMRLGSAVALYASGHYAQAAKLFFNASDLNPYDPEPYLFLGKADAPEIRQSPEFRKRLERFAKLQPENAWANYYYAMSLLDDQNPANASATQAKAKSLLETAVRLDPALAAAHLQLGILFSDRHDLPQAINAYRQAIAADSGLEQAHYRLAQAYRQIGEPEKAHEEIDIFQHLSQSSAQKRERERSDLQRFVVTLKDPSPN